MTLFHHIPIIENGEIYHQMNIVVGSMVEKTLLLSSNVEYLREVIKEFSNMNAAIRYGKQHTFKIKSYYDIDSFSIEFSLNYCSMEINMDMYFKDKITFSSSMPASKFEIISDGIISILTRYAYRGGSFHCDAFRKISLVIEDISNKVHMIIMDYMDAFILAKKWNFNKNKKYISRCDLFPTQFEYHEDVNHVYCYTNDNLICIISMKQFEIMRETILNDRGLNFI